eukprot:1161382-Pelagomonas_calceolata.AAC.3
MVWRVTTFALMKKICRGLHAAAVPLPTAVQPRVLTVLDSNQVHMPLVSIQLVRFFQAVGCCGPLCGVAKCVCCVMRDGVNRTQKEKKEWIWLYRKGKGGFGGCAAPTLPQAASALGGVCDASQPFLHQQQQRALRPAVPGHPPPSPTPCPGAPQHASTPRIEDWKVSQKVSDPPTEGGNCSSTSNKGVHLLSSLCPGI